MKKINIVIVAVCIINTACCIYVNGQTWNITGNTGTNASTNFMGTTDAISLKIRTNNVIRMNITSGGKIAIGNFTPVFKLDVKGGSINTDSVYRIGGNTVLSVKGAQNTFVGRNSGFSNTSGSGNTATGFEALFANTTGTQNVANGFNSLHNNISGSYNIGIGNYALNNNNGSYNTSTGYQSMYTNSTGIQNVAYGMQALYTNSTGTMNSSFGSFSMFYNTTGSKNVANGFGALYHNTSGNSNVAIGSSALSNSTVGNNLVAIGDSALFNQTVNIANIYGSTAIGSRSLLSNTTGEGNTAIGWSTMYSNTTGEFNTAVGSQTMYYTTGDYNTGIGAYALRNNTTGSQNTATGQSASNNNWTGSDNTAYGHWALYSNTGGANNTAIGSNALFGTTGSNNTGLGNHVSTSVGTLSYATAIGAEAVVNANDKLRLGDAGVNIVEGPVAYSTPSDARFKENIKADVKGLDFIMKLQPVSYNFNRLKYAQHVRQHLTPEREQKLTEQSQNRSVGFIAQDVEKTIQQTRFTAFDAVHAPTNETDNYSVGYAEFVVPLVKAVQELNTANEELRILNALLVKRVESLEHKTRIENKVQEHTKDIGPLIEQNSPNPFSEKTVIKFYIPQSAGSGMIKIYSSDGSELKSIPVSTKGFGQTEISGSTLPAGTYTYSLLVDGKVTDTKKMILTK